MSDQIKQGLRVTFDTNVCALLHEPERYAQQLPLEQTSQLWKCIVEGNIQPFVSEATIFVECLSFSDKLKYLSVAGTGGLRPTPDPRSTAMFSDLASRGFRCLHAPLISAEKFDATLEWADDVVYPITTRHHRFCEMLRKFPTVEPLCQLGKQVSAEQPPVRSSPPRLVGDTIHFDMPASWAIALKRAWDDMGTDADRKKFKKNVNALISNWCDNLAVASHYGYGNDVFCTFDEGKTSGQGGPLHHLNRASLLQQGVLIKAPNELLAMAW